MAGISSLLKAAAATQKKVQSQEDAFVAYNWESSAQTYDDFVEYSKYLQNRIQKASDPSDALTYQTKLRSANRSYTSNEIQRQQMRIMEGGGTTKDKMDTIQKLWQRAIDNQDFNLAQNLGSQWDTLSVKLQNEQETAMKAMVASGGKAFDALNDKLTKGFEDVTLPSGEKVTPLAAIARDLEQGGGDAATWKAAQDTMEALRNTVIDQYQHATTQDEVDKLEQKYGPGLADIDKELSFKIGGKSLTTQDVINAAANESFNNPIYSLKADQQFNPSTGKYEPKFTLKENNVSHIDYARQINPQTGMEEYMPLEVRTDQNSVMFGTSNQGRGLDTQITNEGSVIGGDVNGNTKNGRINAGTQTVKRDDSQSIGNRLKQLGIIASHDGTTLKIKLPGESVERRATIQPDGSIRYIADDGNIMEFGLVDRHLGTGTKANEYKDGSDYFSPAGVPRAVSYDEISDFSNPSKFGGNLSQASLQGQRYTQSIVGQTRFNTPIVGNANIRVGNDFNGFGGAAGAGAFQGTSAILQSAGMQRQQIQQAQAREQLQAAQAQLQASSNQFDLNQTPVQQLANNGVLKRQLTVAAPVAPRRVYVAPITTPKISAVSVAPTTQRISGVSVAGPMPTIRF